MMQPRRMTPRLCMVIMAATMTFAVAGAQASGNALQSFPLLRPLIPSGTFTQAIGAVALDESVFAHTTPGYHDLRIFKDDQHDVPMLVRARKQTREVVQPYQVAIRQTAFEVLPDNRIAFEFHTTNRADRPVAISLQTRLRNFEKSVSVKSRNHGSDWEPLVSDQPIFDYSRYMDIRNLRVPIPQTSHTNFQVTIDTITETHASPLTEIARTSRGDSVLREVETSTFRRADFRIDSFTVWGERRSEQFAATAIQPYSVSNLVVEQDDDKQLTTVSFETAAAPTRTSRSTSATASGGR